MLAFTGLETGDASEFVSALPTGITVSSAFKHTGGYSLKSASAQNTPSVWQSGLSLAAAYARCWLYIDELGTIVVDADGQSVLAFDTAAAAFVSVVDLYRNASDQSYDLRAISATLGLVATTKVLPARWYLVELKTTISATVGVVEMRVGGVVIGTLSGNTGTTNIGRVSLGGAFSAASVADFYIDDVMLRDDAYPGDGRCIARQGKAGSPTYDAWTKTASQTAAQVWSETPFSATNNAAFTGATASAQTMLADDISAGTDPIGSGDVINAVRMGLIAKTSGVASVITSTFKASIYSTTAQTSYATTTTYTPKSHSLLVAFVVTTLGATPLDPTTVTGHGVSFAKLTLSARTLSTTHAVSVWVANSGASPTTAAVTADYSGVSQTGGVVIEYEVEGADMSTSAVAAIVQNPTNTAGSGTAETVTLAAAGNSNNRALLFALHLSNTAQTAAGAWTLGAGATPNFNTPATGAVGLFNNSTFDTAGACTGANVAWRMVGLEIKCDLTSGGKMSLRRRIAAADTDEAVTLTTSDAFYASSIFTDTRANLIAAEIGAIKQLSYQARTQTVEDAWLMVDYTPGAGRASKNTRAFPLGLEIGMGWRMPA